MLKRFLSQEELSHIESEGERTLATSKLQKRQFLYWKSHSVWTSAPQLSVGKFSLKVASKTPCNLTINSMVPWKFWITSSDILELGLSEAMSRIVIKLRTNTMKDMPNSHNIHMVCRRHWQRRFCGPNLLFWAPSCLHPCYSARESYAMLLAWSLIHLYRCFSELKKHVITYHYTF